MKNDHNKIGNTHTNKNIIYKVPQKFIYSEMTTAYFFISGHCCSCWTISCRKI